MSNTETQTSAVDRDHRRSVGEWLSCPFTWRIPVYQRHYAWDAAIEAGPIHLFWDTVEEQASARLNGQSPNQHYLGAVLVDNKTRRESPSEKKNFDVVDGQQRLTTIQLALFALIRVAEKSHPDLKEELGKFIFSDEACKSPKLQPTNFDNKQYRGVLYTVYDELMLPGVTMPDESAKKSKVFSTFEFFERSFASFLAAREGKLGAHRVIKSLQKTILDGFDLVLIVLRENDEAQKVFESLNNYSKPLTTFDLIRNNVFHRASFEGEHADEKLFNSHLWQQLEEPYWEESAGQRKKGDENTHIEAYIARMLVAKMQEENIKFNRNDIFKTYKKFSDDYATVVAEVTSAVDYLPIYKYLAAGDDKNPVAPDFRFGLFRWDIWKNKDFYPLIFVILKSEIATAEKQRMISLLESYVVRRGVCCLPSGNYNKDVAGMCKKIGDDPSYQALREILTKSKTNTSRFPDNDEVRQKCVKERFYNSPFKATSYVFEEIAKCEEKSAGEIDICSGLSLDHIAPQGWENNKEWKDALLEQSEDAKVSVAPHTVDYSIDTIGNLTLMSQERNSRKSNKSWDEAKDLLRDSGLQMNRKLAQEEKWNLEKIVNRSAVLADTICKRWPFDQ